MIHVLFNKVINEKKPAKLLFIREKITEHKHKVRMKQNYEQKVANSLIINFSANVVIIILHVWLSNNVKNKRWSPYISYGELMIVQYWRMNA